MILQYNSIPAFVIFNGMFQYTNPDQKPNLKSTDDFKMIRDTLKLCTAKSDGAYTWWLLKAAPLQFIQLFINSAWYDKELVSVLKKEIEIRKPQ